MYAGISAVFIRAIWITYTVIPPAVFLSLMVIGYWNWWWVDTERSCWVNRTAYFSVFKLSGGGKPNSLNVLSLVSESFKCGCARKRCHGWTVTACRLGFFWKHTLRSVASVLTWGFIVNTDTAGCSLLKWVWTNWLYGSFTHRWSLSDNCKEIKIICWFTRDSNNPLQPGIDSYIDLIIQGFLGFFLETSQLAPGVLCLTLRCVFGGGFIAVNCWWGRLCVFSPCGVVLARLTSAVLVRLL